MEIKPLDGYILIAPVAEKEKTDSGLIIVPGKEDKGNTGQGTIVEVGAAKKGAKIKKGDFVLFTKYGPAEVGSTEKCLLLRG